MARAKAKKGSAKAKSTAGSAKPRAQRTNKPVATPRRPKPTAAKPAPAKSLAGKPPETRRTRAPTISERAETPRTRAPTISVRAETPRTRAPTTPPRSRRETLEDPPIVVAPHEATATSSRDAGAELADPARAEELAELAGRVDTLSNPDLLVALATQIDTLGMQLAYEISRHAQDAAHIAPLRPVLLRVPALYGKTLLRAAEMFDDQGSPRRAVYVLFEALRKAFDHDVIAAVAGALAFVLEAHGQSTPAKTIRALLTARDEQRAGGVDRREVRTRFSASLDELRDRGVDWDALEDAPEQFD